MNVRRPVMHSLLVLVLVVLAPAGIPSASAAPDPVTTCGQRLLGAGILTGDLDCTNSGVPHAIIIGHGSLDLQGFTLTGFTTIRCEGSCRIANGTIIGETSGLKSIDARNLAIYSGGFGIAADRGLRLRNVIVASVGVSASSYYGQAIIEDSTITSSSGVGVSAVRVRLVRSGVTGCAHSGVDSQGKVLLKDSTVTGSAFAADCSENVSVKNRICNWGPNGGVACTSDAECPDGSCTFPKPYRVCDGGPNGGAACRGGFSEDCPGASCHIPFPCGDVLAGREPVLLGSTTCGTSVVRSPSATTPQHTWGVCSLD